MAASEHVVRQLGVELRPSTLTIRQSLLLRAGEVIQWSNVAGGRRLSAARQGRRRTWFVCPFAGERPWESLGIHCPK